MLSQTLLLELLKKELKISSVELKQYEKEAKKLKKDLETYVIEKGKVDEQDLYTSAAKKLDIPLVALKGREIKKDVLNLVPAPLAQAHQLIAFDATKKEILLAMLDPEDIQTIEFLQRKTGLSPKVSLTTPGDMKDALRRYHADLNEEMGLVSLSQDTSLTPAQEKDLKKAAEELPIVNIVNSMLEHAVYEGASDIHIEPVEKEVLVRYRVDGMLKQVMSLPKAVQSGITARIKILATLKIDEHMLPQDGRFKLQVQDEKFSFRVSILPVYDGEKIVLRLLHEGQKAVSLDQLGLLPKARALLEEAIERPHGMILVTGPTGSGKTTTLYSVLGMLNTGDVNISTIEDPIEYHVKGINQSQVNTRVGFTFAAGLRAFLRQDPDIIMVGEIRDEETAEIAVHAAMTGHLVLSTLHTNDAPTTLPRLLDMGIPPFLVAFTVNIILGQRLVRKICEHCKEAYSLGKGEVQALQKVLAPSRLKQLYKEQGLDISKKDAVSHTFYRGAGCRRCGKSGYKGRIGIYEVLDVDKELAQKINARATATEIKQYANKKGMVTMLEDGILKAKTGITTIEEVLRATRD
ncbi:MAG: Flp pilus assembly complex ATPase component TadA [Candidatus Magasanikbacteria bacterium]|nr:Flp pilus assembly complex ATPase component TadA [Candidatus Magasanikbacteria bacterium]